MPSVDPIRLMDCRRHVRLYQLILRGLGTALITLACTAVRAGPWVALPPHSSEVKPGSALDLSMLGQVNSDGAPIPAGTFGRIMIGAQGKFEFAGRHGTPVRFFAASMGVSHASGAFPDGAGAKRLALQLRRAGYNLVRFHMVDAVLMNKTRADLAFDQVQFDRLHALLAALKKQGIYWMFDGLSSPMGGYSASVVDRNNDQWGRSPFNVKAGVYVSDAYREHYKALVKKLFATVNPYTGMTIIDDPALAGIVLVNEGGIDFAVIRMGSELDRATLVGPFNRWLKTRYGTDAALQKAWGATEPEAFDPTTESLEQENVRLPASIFTPTARNIDAQKFFIDREIETATWMTTFFRRGKAQGGLGYEGPLTSLNNWTTLQANLSRSQFAWIDLHAYFDEPSRFADPGSTIRQVSSLDDPNPGLGPRGAPQHTLGYFQALAANRQVGKPFSVSEHSHAFWNTWRREAIIFAAYASLQDWDMICQFNEPVILPSPDEAATPPRHRAIYPYEIGLDPIAKATETLAALLFLRADVAASTHPVVFQLDSKNFSPPNISMGDAGGLRYSVAALALLTRIGVLTDAATAPDAPPASAAGLPATWRGPVKPIRLHGTESIEKLLAILRAAGAVPRDTRTDLQAAVYESDTGQLLIRAREQSLSIMTPRTEAVSFATQMPQGLEHLHVERFDTPAVVALTSLDGKDLGASKRMLLMVTTDAINSGMSFRVMGANGIQTFKPGEATRYEERQVLQDLGHRPILLKSIKTTLTIRNAGARLLAVHALAQDGERTTNLGAHATSDGTLVIDIDTEKTPTTYFEISASRPP